LYPEFDPWLRDSMLAETRTYFRKLISENLGVDHVVDSDFVMINQRLAELYGIKGVTGSEIRPVKLDENSPRGGFLTQAAILKVTANGTETSPILRGVWVVERILGVHINPPPPNTPAVEADASGAKTIRDIVEIHRQSASCASCHDIMDPPGLALESFDAIGTFRSNYRLGGRPGTITLADGKKIPEPQISILTNRGERKQIRIGAEIDASGILPDGREFEDLEGLKAIMIADRETLARNLARQLTIYATGKGYRFSDRAVINGIVEKTKGSGNGIRSIIHGVVTSPLFLQTEKFKP
jgi:hypothetical protein